MNIKERLITWLCSGLAVWMQLAEPADLPTLIQRTEEALNMYEQARFDSLCVTLELNSIVRTIGVLGSLLVLLLVNWGIILHRTTATRAFCAAVLHKFTPKRLKQGFARLNALRRRLWAKTCQWVRQSVDRLDALRRRLWASACRHATKFIKQFFKLK
jgi:hypothetical protein